MLFRCVALAFLFGLRLVAGARGEPYTPAPGSPERAAICDGLRAHFSGLSMRPLPEPLLFKIDFLRVESRYAYFEGSPVFKGRPAIDGEHMPDMAYYALLQRGDEGWRVILDLSRSDVPSKKELKQLRKRLPRDLPAAVLADHWRERLGLR